MDSPGLTDTIMSADSEFADLAPLQINPTLSFVGEFLRIRDRIVVDSKLQKKMDDSGALNVTLIGRVIEHAPGFNLTLPGRIVRLVASSYDARGGAIDVGGHPGSPGASGSTGAPGIASAGGGPRRDGGPGGAGKSGGRGDGAGTIILLCERLHDVRMRANGSAGGAGGDGGAGGRGGNGRAQSPHIEGFDGTAGGAGGAAGAGGPGGPGGAVQVDFVSADNAQAISISAAGGPGGSAGARGKGGKRGVPDGDHDGLPGAAGPVGAPGANGTNSANLIDPASYFARVAAFLGSAKTAAWADYRLESGIYFYRLFKPNLAEGVDVLRQAMGEFDAVLQLRPGDPNAARYQRQILLGQNVLGLSHALDLIPDFTVQFADYTSSAGLVAAFYTHGIAILLSANATQQAVTELETKVVELQDRVNFEIADRDAAKRATDGALETHKHATARVNELSEQIRVAAAKHPETSISIGDIASTALAVGTAVASVIAAVPTAGASLFALAPALAGLGVQLVDISQHLFEATKAETDALKQQYAKVGKNIDDIVKGVKSVINLVDTIKKLTAATTNNNAEVVALMRQGVEASYELLLAKLHLEQADLTLTARTLQVSSDTALLALVQTQLERLKIEGVILKGTGQSAILATQRRADGLLTIAFQAQRSVEIYTLKDESARIAFDSGYVKPDTDHAFADGDIGIAEMVSAYTASWVQFLNPLGLRDDYTAYFRSDGQFDFASGVLLPDFDDASLATFRESNSLSFNIDLAQLPMSQFEVKVAAVHVALVGVQSAKTVLNCRLRHGARYLIRTRDGFESDQLLQPHVTQTSARFAPFEVTGTPVTNGMSGELNALSFWGRGVCGEWEISVDPAELAADNADLSGLTAIQLWIATQAFIPVN
jgi:hypothetical protein